MVIRTASASWEGTLREGNGRMRIGPGGLETPYSFASRFEEESGTNPEEVLGAAHAGCFSMAFAAGLGRAGYDPEWVQTEAKIHFQKLDEGWQVTKILLQTEAKVPGIAEEEFQSLAQISKEGCPISKALAAVDIDLEARLVS